MFWIVIIIGIIGLIIYLKSKQRKQIVRFMRHNCKYCIESQPEWDAFKANAVANKSDFDIVDVDLHDNSIHTRKWLESYKIDGVPKIIKITGFGSTEYIGPHISTAYMQFMSE